eukprot:2357187-Amphidinium_carterae.1
MGFACNVKSADSHTEGGLVFVLCWCSQEEVCKSTHNKRMKSTPTTCQGTRGMSSKVVSLSLSGDPRGDFVVQDRNWCNSQGAVASAGNEARGRYAPVVLVAVGLA